MGLTAPVDLGTHPEWVPEPIPHRSQGMMVLADMVWFPSHPLDIYTHIYTYYILLYTHLFYWPLRLVESYFPNQGWNLRPLQRKCTVLTMGLPGISEFQLF